MRRRLRRYLTGFAPLCRCCMTPLKQRYDRDTAICTVCGHEATRMAIVERGWLRTFLLGA